MEKSEKFQEVLKELGEKLSQGEPLTDDFNHEDLALLYSMGHSLYKIGDYAQAQNVFQRLVISKPLERRNWLAYGGALQMNGDYEEALTAWSMAALLDDNDPLPHFHAAECLFSLKQPDEGEKALSEVERRLTDENEGDLRDKIRALRKSWNQFS